MRDVDHNFLDSDDLEPGQSFSFTFCVGGTYHIEDARSNARATISVLGRNNSVAEPKSFTKPGHIAESEPFTKPGNFAQPESFAEPERKPITLAEPSDATG